MKLDEAIMNRFSVRTYTQTPVEKEKITQVLEASTHAPCSCNLQLMRYVVIEDQGLREQLTPIVSKKLQWAPVNIVFFLDSRFNRHRSASVMGLGASMQNMNLKAHELGLATCPMAGFSGDERLKQILGVPDFFEAVLILGLGYPETPIGKHERSRIPLEEIVDYNAFESERLVLKEDVNLRNWTYAELLDYRRRIAPVYRYGDRYALQSFNKLIYKRIFEQLKRTVRKASCVLDLHSYDGFFLKQMIDNGYAANFLASDMLDHTLNCLKKNYSSLRCCRINENQEMLEVESESIDLVTYVHKINFTLDLYKQICEASRVLNKEGQLFLSFPLFGLNQRLQYKIRQLHPGQTYNVYDGNEFYKIGPRDLHTLRHVKRTLDKVGFYEVSGETENFEYFPNTFHRYFFGVYQKRS